MPKKRVRAYCPGGAPNEQLAGKLTTSTFLAMFFVLRCDAHAIQGAIETAWGADETVREITDVVKAVGQLLRLSSRFWLRFGQTALD